MRRTRSLRIALLVGALAAIVAAGTVLAEDGNRGISDGDHGNNGNGKILNATLAGIPASLTGQPFMGATGGGVPWQIDRGRAKLSMDGRLKVDVRGLVLAAGTSKGTNPIATGHALVSCSGAVVAMSGPVPFSTTGDARVDTMVSLPASCLAPVVFFAGITANGDRWFAVTGF